MGRRLNLWLLLIVLVCAVSFWAGRGAHIPILQPKPEPETTDGPPGTDEPAIHLLILNGTDRKGLAGEVGLLVFRSGCVAENIGNAPSGKYPVSLLINRRLKPERARELAMRLGGLPVLVEWAERKTEDAVLVLGADHEKVLSALGQ